jgi:hypothetical protein
MKLFQRAKDDNQATNTALVGERVEIMIRGVGRTSGKVKEVDEGFVVIDLIVKVDDAAQLGEPDAVLEYTAIRGLYKQRGTARFDVNGAETVRFVGGPEPELVQRRDFVRVDVNFPVNVFLKDGWAMEFDAMNLSGNGILLAPPSGKAKQLQIGMLVSLKVPLYDGQGGIEVRGTVVREAGRGAMGIRFDHIAEADQERLVRYVARQEREQRRRMGEL